jgi:membrane protein YqaA with SNARE-associated domain
MLAPKLHDKIRSYVTKLERFADRSWYPPLIGILAALDNLVIVIPNDGILVASSMLIPKRWLIFAVCVAIGSTIGAMILSSVVHLQGLPWILDYYPGINETEMWNVTEKFFDEYGLLLVFAIGASPIMQQPVIILAGLANTPLLALAAAIFAGRMLKFTVMAYLGSHSPKMLKKIWGLKDELNDAGVKID